MKQGTKYEDFVGNLQRALIETDELFQHKRIQVEQNKKIIDRCGIKREFDLYWEYEFAGVIYKTVIECKDYSRPITVDKIDAFIGKLHDLPGLIPVFATTIGYQSGAKNKAEQNGIEALIVREQNESDWHDKDGNSYIREININFLIHSRITVTEVHPFLDRDWLLENTDITLDQLGKAIIVSPEVTKVEDCKQNTLKPLIDYLEEIDRLRDDTYGEHEHTFVFEEAYIFFEDRKLKMKQLIVKYNRSEPVSMPMRIDYSKEMIGVMEYLSRKEKVSIFRNGKIIRENMI